MTEEVMEQDELLQEIKDILILMDDEEELCPPIDECPNKEQMENDDCKKCWANYILAKAKQHYHPSIEAQKLQVELAKKQERERIINIVNTPSGQVGNKVSTNSVVLFRKFILRRIGKPFS